MRRSRSCRGFLLIVLGIGFGFGFGCCHIVFGFGFALGFGDVGVIAAVVAVIGAVILVLDGDDDVFSSFVVQKPRLFAGVVVIVVVVAVVRFGFVRPGVYVVMRSD